MLTQQLLKLARERIYKFRKEPFRLASGGLSQHYFNCKKLTLVPEYLELLARTLRDETIPRANLVTPAAVGGLTLGADPIAYALSLAYLNKKKEVYPFVVRKKKKEHGTGRRIEAEFDSAPLQITEVLVLDDTVTTGGSSLEAVEALREAGFTVQHCLSIVDRQEGAREALDAKGVKLISLFCADQFF